MPTDAEIHAHADEHAVLVREAWYQLMALTGTANDGSPIEHDVVMMTVLGPSPHVHGERMVSIAIRRDDVPLMLTTIVELLTEHDIQVGDAAAVKIKALYDALYGGGDVK